MENVDSLNQPLEKIIVSEIIKQKYVNTLEASIKNKNLNPDTAAT